MMFDFIDPAVIEPFAEQAFGKSVYAKSMTSQRKAFMIRLFTRGFLKR